MEKTTLFCFLVMLAPLNVIWSSNCLISPANPQAGQQLTVNYDPAGTVLEGFAVYGVAFVLEQGQSPKAFDLEMVKSEKGYVANFQPMTTAQAVYFKFGNENGSRFDTNNEQGYYTMIYEGETAVKHAYFVASTIYVKYADIFGLTADAVQARKLLAQEVTNDSDFLSDDYINYYSILVRILEDKKSKAEIIDHLKGILTRQNLSEEEMVEVANIARILKEHMMYNSIKEQLNVKFPEGRHTTNDKFAKFRMIKDFNEQLAMYVAELEKHGEDENFKSMLDYMERRIALTYGNRGDFENMYKYAGRVSTVRSEVSVYNKYAWNCTGDSIAGEGHRIREGLAMSMKSLQLLEQSMKTSTGRVSYQSERDWNRGLKNYYGSYCDTYALLAYKNGDLEEAIKYQKIAVETAGLKKEGIYSRYTVYLEKGKGAQAAMSFLEDMISKGKATDAMKQRFIKLYNNNVSIDQASIMYMAKLEEQAKVQQARMVKKEMIKKAAPDFSLKNLKGEEISLDSLKGKLVVIDFWATWCGPCKASFPAMQEVVDKYKDSDDVVFLFVDTWERTEKKEEQALNFINEKGYSFNVLMDNESQMVAAFGVRSIPSKFMLDKNGNIRFNNTGFKGTNQTLVDEISMMIDILQAEE